MLLMEYLRGMSDLAPHELRILIAVERERGFTAAAASLGMTQSAVSHAVRTCERKLGAVLFDRGRHGARPTAAGTRAVAYARRIVRLLEAMGQEVRGAGDGAVTGPLRIAAFRSAAAHLLPAVLERLTGRHPGLSPEVRIVREIGRGTAGKSPTGGPTWASPPWTGRARRRAWSAPGSSRSRTRWRTRRAARTPIRGPCR